MSFRNTILCSRDTQKRRCIIYDALFSKEKMQYFVGFETHEEDIIVHDGYRKGRPKSNFSNHVCNYCKKV